MASLQSASTVRARGENRTAFHAVETLFAVAVAIKLLRARETEMTEIADCGYRRGRKRRRDRGDQGNSDELRKRFRNRTARSGRRTQSLEQRQVGLRRRRADLEIGRVEGRE